MNPCENTWNKTGQKIMAESEQKLSDCVCIKIKPEKRVKKNKWLDAVWRVNVHKKEKCSVLVQRFVQCENQKAYFVGSRKKTENV